MRIGLKATNKIRMKRIFKMQTRSKIYVAGHSHRTYMQQHIQANRQREIKSQAAKNRI